MQKNWGYTQKLYLINKMAKVGYARVPTQKQDLSEQIAALEKFGCEKIFSGKHSGIIIG